jgi:hypothetical protein
MTTINFDLIEVSNQLISLASREKVLCPPQWEQKLQVSNQLISLASRECRPIKIGYI